MLIRLRLILGFILFSTMTCMAQLSSLALLGDKKKRTIPFEYSAGYIILEVDFNNYFTQKFILDTGSEHVIYFHKEVAELLGMELEKKIKIYGADLSQQVLAHISRKVSIAIKNCKPVITDLVVLDRDFLNIYELTGEKIDGIIGGRYFRNLILNINYKKKQITFYHPDYFNERLKGFEKVDLNILNYKPYIQSSISMGGKDAVPVELLLDTGAALSVMLNAHERNKIEIPENAIAGSLGRGMGGYVKGYIGKIEQLDIANTNFGNVYTNFQNIEKDAIELDYYRDGLLGNLILEKFNFYINYLRSELYFKARPRLKRKLKYNKSGIMFLAFGEKLNEYLVYEVIPNSPADDVGIKKGDILKKLGLFSSDIYSLKKIDKKMKRKSGKKINMVLLRDGKEMKKSFILKDYLQN